nr:PREDICTED: uncharacterized protein LOC108952041 isoform X2 [Musa acuminata subsp. malaccensis]
MHHFLQSSLEKTVDHYQKFMKAEKYFDKHNEKEQFPYVELQMYHLLQSSLEKTVDHYQKFMKAEKYFDKHNEKEQNHEKGFACSEGNFKLLEIAERFIETDFAKLNIDGLEQLENDLNDAFKWTTSRKATMMVQRRIGENRG